MITFTILTLGEVEVNRKGNDSISWESKAVHVAVHGCLFFKNKTYKT
jgi:hypothetical protein